MADETPEKPVKQAEHPGKMLRQLLDDRGWTGDELADITGFARTHLSNVVSGKVGVSPDMAVALAGAFGNQPSDWLRWNAEYQLSLVTTDLRAVETRAKLYRLAPIRDMQRRGWIRETKTVEELETELTRFFGSPIDAGVAFPAATLRSNPLTDLNAAERAWCFQARRRAEALVHVAPYDDGRFDAAEKKLRLLAAYPKEIERLSEILAYYGIRFVVVEPLPGAKIDGAAFWIDGSPCIAVSARWDRIDAFWFTIMHEFMHIKNRDASSIDVNLIQEGDNGIAIRVSDDECEQRTNAQAANALVPTGELDSFIKRTSPLYSAQRIVQFAHRIKMHPGIIVGQLQHRGELRYSSHRDFLVKIRKYLVETALTDGWGQSPSVT